MEKKLHIASASLNQTPLDWEGNLSRAKFAVDIAKDKGVELLCLPELCISGYGCEDMFMADWVLEKSKEYLLKLAEHSSGIRVIAGLPFSFRDNRYNVAAVIGDGEIFALVPKRHLANDGIHYEKRWFTPWTSNEIVKDELRINGKNVPFASTLFKINKCLFGIEICEDAWVKDRPALSYIEDGASLICNLSASHFSLLKLKKRISTTLSYSDKFQDVYYNYSNLLGNEAGRAIYDGSSFISKGSKILCSAPRFSFRELELISEVIEVESKFEKCKNFIDISQKNKTDVKHNPTGDRALSFEKSKFLKEEEFTRAVSLGMFDYMRKSRSRGYVISLSGGADSAACACLSFLSLKLALNELGSSKLSEYLFGSLSELKLDSSFISDYLTLVYLKTKNNSQETFDAAKKIADGLKGNFGLFEIDEIISQYSAKVSGFEKRDFSWEQDSIPLQNIQARARGPLVWFIANLKNALLLSTSNRSEAAVGYTTMDGDTCGGLSPIGGIDKAFLLSWLKWLSIKENHEFGDFSFLEAVLSLSPSAELKPIADKQTDEQELMPYSIMDIIERGFVGEKKSFEELTEMLTKKDPNISKSQAEELVKKFLSLWRQNQWKRERYAPSFHLDDQSLDPKTWCRFPILSGRLY